MDTKLSEEKPMAESIDTEMAAVNRATECVRLETSKDTENPINSDTTDKDASDQQTVSDGDTTAQQNLSGEKSKEEDGPKLLDLAFAMDCTGSMGSYIHQAQQNIRRIVEDIVSKEAADVRLALVEYRDHPPQDTSFVTRVNDFTSSVREMKTWLDASSASGGGDGPEAVADALHQVLKLSWRQEATKICVFISDAPPHGLGMDRGDGFPNGCPVGLDPMEIASKLAEKSITLYLVGCEPSINRYKEFFSALAHVTGGQYVPLGKANLLSAVIIGGAQEELSLQHLMEEINEEVQQELEGAAEASVSHKELSKRVHTKMKERGHRTKQLNFNGAYLPQASATAESLSYCTNMAEVRSKIPSAKYDDIGGYSRKSRSRAASSKHKKKSAERTETVAEDAAPKGGISSLFSGLTSWFGGSSAPEVPPAAAAPPAAPAMSVVAPMPAPAAAVRPPGGEDIYEIAEDEEIAEEQVQRMVQKAIMTNKLRSKTKTSE